MFLSRALSVTISRWTNASKEFQRKEMARGKEDAGRSIMTLSRTMMMLKRMMRSLLKMRCLRYHHFHPSQEDQQRETPRFKLSSTPVKAKSHPALKLQRTISSVHSCQHQQRQWTMKWNWLTTFRRHHHAKMRTHNLLYLHWRHSSQKLPLHRPK